MNGIGGFFELELNKGKEYHTNAIKLNLGRSGLEYILRAKNVNKIYIPCYICEVMLIPIERTKIAYEFYHIDENMEPLFNYSKLGSDEVFLYVNYFGIKNAFISQLAQKGMNLLIDNSQSFYSKEIKGVDSIYSARKFFGVPDGGYLYTNKRLNIELEQDNSSNRFKHLVERVENGSEAAYRFFVENDNRTYKEPIKKMSKITERLLSNINYENIANIRKENFQFLHEKLNLKNQLKIDVVTESIPMAYPFYSENKELRNYLIQNKIYVPQYWHNVLQWVEKDTIEYKFVKQLVPLPIDQRYNQEHMSYIVHHVLKL